MKVVRMWGIALAGLAIVLATTWWLLMHSEWVKIDRCLDGGGRWMSAQQKCEGEAK